MPQPLTYRLTAGLALAVALTGCTITLPAGVTGFIPPIKDPAPTASPKASAEPSVLPFQTPTPRSSATPGQPDYPPLPPHASATPRVQPTAAASASPDGRKPLVDAQGNPALERPWGIAYARDGAAIVADNSTPDWRVLKLSAQGEVSRLLGNGDGPSGVAAGDGGTIGIFEPRSVALDAQDNAYVVSLGPGNASRIHRLDTQGQATLVYEGGPDEIEQIAVWQDTIYYLGKAGTPPQRGADGQPVPSVGYPHYRVMSLSTTGGQPQVALDGLDVGFGNYSLGADRQGRVYVGGHHKLLRWTPGAAAAETLADDPHFEGTFANLLIDEEATHLVGATQWEIFRYDLENQAYQPLAGSQGDGLAAAIGIPGALAWDAEGRLAFTQPEQNTIRKLPASRVGADGRLAFDR